MWVKIICEKLQLNWDDCLQTAKQMAISTTNYCYTSATNEEEQTMQTFYRKITVIDSQSQIIKGVITLDGDIKFIENLKFIEGVLRDCSGDTIMITDIKPGSIKVFIEGSSVDIEKIVNLIKSKTLTELNGFPIKDIQILDANETRERERDNQQNNIISLSGKFNKSNFPTGWDTPEKLINQTTGKREQSLASQVRSRENERNEIGKLINVNQINIPLILKIKKEETDEKTEKHLYSITLQVCTTNDQNKLPENLKILAFYESSGEKIDEKIAGRKTLRSSFTVESKSPFYIEIKLGEETIEKGLYVL